MSDIAIRAENLSKRYRIGLKEEVHDTLGGAITDFVRRPLNNLRRLSRLSRFHSEGGDGEDIVWALKHVSFEIKRGEVVGIIGRNGAGKTTLLKVLSRITEPTAGHAEIRGRVSSLLEVGTGFHPDLTGRDNVYLNGGILGMSRAEIDRKFDEIVDFSGVERFIDTPVKRYSSGMQVRLAFAVAAHLEPEILLVDEVLAVGDAEFQKKCLGKMARVAKEGRTVLFVSHNMPAIIALCTRALLIEVGRLSVSGDPERVIATYLRTKAPRDGEIVSQDAQRQGTGRLRFVSWSLVDDVLGAGGKIGCNHGCTFYIHYAAEQPTASLRNVSVAIVIWDFLGQRLLTGATHFQNRDFAVLQPRGTFVCHFARLPLLPDVYNVHLWCSVEGETADLVEHAGSLEVVPDDVFGTGRFPDRRKHGRIVVPHSWDVKSA